MTTVLIIDADRVARRFTTSAVRYGGLAPENANGLRQRFVPEAVELVPPDQRGD